MRMTFGVRLALTVVLSVVTVFVLLGMGILAGLVVLPCDGGVWCSDPRDPTTTEWMRWSVIVGLGGLPTAFGAFLAAGVRVWWACVVAPLAIVSTTLIAVVLVNTDFLAPLPLLGVVWMFGPTGLVEARSNSVRVGNHEH
jgi:hypothetical protein